MAVCVIVLALSRFSCGRWWSRPLNELLLAACAASAFDKAEGEGWCSSKCACRSWLLTFAADPRRDISPELPCEAKWSRTSVLELERENAVSGRSGFGRCRLKKLLDVFDRESAGGSGCC